MILVRHGQTEWNRVERFRGRVDLELTEAGVKQAEATARRLVREPIAAVYSSPLKRTMTTAGVLARPLGLPVTPFEYLIDVDFGNWRGLSLEEAQKADAGLYRLWVERPDLVTFPGGEGLAQVRDRFDTGLKLLAGRHKDQTILLVSHKAVCKVIELVFLGLDNSHFWQVEQDLCAVNIFSLTDDRGPVALKLNDTCHLKGLRA